MDFLFLTSHLCMSFFRKNKYFLSYFYFFIQFNNFIFYLKEINFLFLFFIHYYYNFLFFFCTKHYNNSFDQERNEFFCCLHIT